MTQDCQKPFRASSILLPLVAGIAAVGLVLASRAWAAGTSTRVRVAHLAPFAAAGGATGLTISLDGLPQPGILKYGDAQDYQILLAEPESIRFEVTSGSLTLLDLTMFLAEGDQSLVILGDNDLVPFDLYLLADTPVIVPAGKVALRIAHAAPIASSVVESRIDICRQDGKPFDYTAHNIRYKRVSRYLTLPAEPLDIYFALADPLLPCTGTAFFDPPPIDLPAGATLTLYLAGDGINRPFALYTFEQGLISVKTGWDPSRTYLPSLAAP